MPSVGEHGRGTITRRKDGRLQVVVPWPDHREFRYVPASYVRREPREARRQAEKIRSDLIAARDRDLNPSRLTLAEWLPSWVEALGNAKRKRVAPRTLEHYAMIVTQHIVPALGHHKLTGLRRRHVQAWLDADPASPQTIHHHHAVLRRALNTITGPGGIIDPNPAIGVELPEVDWDGEMPLSLVEARALLAATREDWYGPLWRTAIDSGLRASELLGLGWEDFEPPMIRVAAQMQRLNGAWVRRPILKAGRTLERLTLMASTVAALETHRIRMAAARTPDWTHWGHIFITRYGKPPHQSELLRAFHAACDKAGIERRRFHDLRGSSATLMADLGITEEVRMARLGHATKRMARHYAKVGEVLDRGAAEKLEEALG